MRRLTAEGTLISAVAGDAWGAYTVKTLSNSRHIIVPGASHLPPFNACSEGLVFDFLNGKPLAQLDATCIESVKMPQLKVDLPTPKPPPAQ